MKLMYIKQRYMSIFRRYIVIPFKEIKGPKAVKKPFSATSLQQSRNIFAGSSVTNLQSGTISWRWNDDYGQIHRSEIPKSY